MKFTYTVGLYKFQESLANQDVCLSPKACSLKGVAGVEDKEELW